MSDLLLGLGLPELTAAVLLLAFNAYALTGGADFGGGFWDLLASGPRREAQRKVIATAIAPIWEANHVWLVIVVVVCFTAFPPVFAVLGTVLHIPLTIALVGIVCRGSAFIFRSYGAHTRTQRRRWGLLFAGASVITPFLLGVVVGAISTGAVGRAQERIGAQASFAEVFVNPWLAPFPMAIGALALALFALLSATYLTVAATDDEVREDFRRRALGSAAAVFLAALGALVLSMEAAPMVRTGLTGAIWSLPLQLATGAAALTGIWALWRRHYGKARVAVAAQTSLIIWGWAAAQYPYLVPPTLTIRAAAAPTVTLEVLLLLLAGGAAVLIPSLAYLLRTFMARAHDDRTA
ncbi:MAG: cytochrome d ubiquinol oxidase subunit II [Gemmatimonadaceae bacterium]